MANPWDRGGLLGPDWSSSSATESPGTVAQTVIPTPASDLWLGGPDALARQVYDTLQRVTGSPECLLGCLAGVAVQAFVYGDDLWNEVLEIADYFVNTPAGNPSDYASFGDCARLLFSKLLLCLSRCGGADLAADFLEFWLFQTRQGATFQLTSEVVSLQMPDEIVTAQVIYFPLTWQDLLSRPGVKLDVTPGFETAREQVLIGVIHRLRGAPSDLFPSQQTNLIEFPTDAQGHSRIPPEHQWEELVIRPARNALLQDGRQHLVVETPIVFSHNLDQITLARVTLLSDVDVSAERVRYALAGDDYVRELELSPIPVPEDETVYGYGYRVRIESWSARLWDSYDPNLGAPTDFLQLLIYDDFFYPLQAERYGCAHHFTADERAKNYLIMTDTISSPPTALDMEVFLPDSARLVSSKSFRVVEDGRITLP